MASRRVRLSSILYDLAAFLEDDYFVEHYVGGLDLVVMRVPDISQDGVEKLKNWDQWFSENEYQIEVFDCDSPHQSF